MNQPTSETLLVWGVGAITGQTISVDGDE